MSTVYRITNPSASQNEVASELAGFAPARAVLAGKTMTEKRTNMLAASSVAVSLYFADAKGKLGQAARAGVSEQGIRRMARNARHGNYADVAGALAILLGESIVISNRASYEALSDRFEGKLADLKDGGYKGEKPTAKRVAIEKAIELIESVNGIIVAILAMEAEEKAKREADQQKLEGDTTVTTGDDTQPQQ